MLGAIFGDIAGAPVEFSRNRDYDVPIFTERACWTDDTILTCATASVLMAGEPSPAAFAEAYVDFAKTFPSAAGRPLSPAWGSGFIAWVHADALNPRGSMGNGAAMRAGPIGWWSDDPDEVRELAHASVAITHDHDESRRAAEAVAGVILRARQGADLASLRAFLTADLGYRVPTYASARETHRYDETCPGCMPDALACLLEADGFEDAVRKAISLGGDADTMGAIVGAMAEAVFGMPEPWRDRTLALLGRWPLPGSHDLARIAERFADAVSARASR